MTDFQAFFDIRGLNAVVTGGSGQLEKGMAQVLVQSGRKVAVLGLHAEKAGAVAQDLSARGGFARGMGCDVRSRTALESALVEIEQALGPVDILVNAAGGNQTGATTSPDQNIYSSPSTLQRSVLFCAERAL